jgi:hypothetical protein
MYKSGTDITVPYMFRNKKEGAEALMDAGHQIPGIGV